MTPLLLSYLALGPYANIAGGTVVSDRTSLAYLHSVRFLNSGSLQDKKIGWRCSGSIIHPRLVLTAAHCFPESIRIEKTKTPISQIAGEVFFRLSPRDDYFSGMKIKKYIRHKDYSDEWAYVFPDAWNPTKSVNDLAIVLLEKEIPSEKKPATIIDKNYKIEDKMLLLAGYGKTKENADSEIPALRFAEVPFASRLNNKMDFFAGSGNPEDPQEIPSPKGACLGDSGGGVFLSNEKHLVGVISRGPDAAHGGCLSSVTIATDARYYHDWIVETSKTLLQE